jgi:hypothetical protein
MGIYHELNFRINLLETSLDSPLLVSKITEETTGTWVKQNHRSH